VSRGKGTELLGLESVQTLKLEIGSERKKKAKLLGRLISSRWAEALLRAKFVDKLFAVMVKSHEPIRLLDAHSVERTSDVYVNSISNVAKKISNIETKMHCLRKSSE
jgi:hypothetical protein